MSTLHLYVAVTLIWSATWFAITFQLGEVAPEISVVWRFALAAFVLLAYAWWRRTPLTYSARDHQWIAVQGFFMFGPSYICVYLSEQYLASGLVAVVFSLIVFWNIIGMRVFFAAPFNPKITFAAALGVGGVALVFWPELENVSASPDTLRGLGLAVLGTILSALGNMAAVKNQQRHIPIIPLNGFGMMYGAAFMAAYAAIFGFEFAFEWSFSYVASLLYLSLFGTVLAFGGYLTLIRRIGAERAGYIGVAIPVVALIISTVFENLRWELPIVIGVFLCILGNVLILRDGKRQAPAT